MGWTFPQWILRSKIPNERRIVVRALQDDIPGAPDFIEDRRNFSVAFSRLSPAEQIKFAKWMIELSKWAPVGFVMSYNDQLIHLANIVATGGRMQAEALLRTVGKWEEE